MHRFDDLWTDTVSYAELRQHQRALTRRYPIYPLDPALNFPPRQNYRDRAR